MNQYMPIQERFFAQVLPEPNSGCWLWTGEVTRNHSDLRPRLKIDGKLVSAYRFAYKEFRGEIAEGLLVCHKCDTSICVNPDHLFVGTHKDNQQDALRKGRHTSQVHPEATAERARRMAANNVGSYPLRGGLIPATVMVDLPNRLDAGELVSVIATEFGVTRQAVLQAAKRQLRRLQKARGSS